MRFSRLDIHHVRNLSGIRLELSQGLNYFYGANGAGKTALLEAVHLLCRGRSFRTQRSRSLIQFGADALVVRGEGNDELLGDVSLGLRKDRQAKTELRRNGTTVHRFSEVARLTPLQVMLPGIAELVFGGPAGRRSWLDWGTFHVKPGFLDRQRQYLRAVRQRNVLLRNAASDSERRAWDRRAAELGILVTDDRLEYLDAVEPHFQEALKTLAPELAPGLTLSYRRGWGRDQTLEKLLGERSGGEVKYATTLWGPHRADVQLRMDDANASGVLSRGQGKMVASAMQIAQAALLSALEHRSTLFLIDDAGAELDVEHNERLFGMLQQVGGQIMATTTVSPRVDGSIVRIARERLGAAPAGSLGFRVFHVEQGRCEESE